MGGISTRSVRTISSDFTATFERNSPIGEVKLTTYPYRIHKHTYTNVQTDYSRMDADSTSAAYSARPPSPVQRRQGPQLPPSTPGLSTRYADSSAPQGRSATSVRRPGSPQAQMAHAATPPSPMSFVSQRATVDVRAQWEQVPLAGRMPQATRKAVVAVVAACPAAAARR